MAARAQQVSPGHITIATATAPTTPTRRAGRGNGHYSPASASPAHSVGSISSIDSRDLSLAGKTHRQINKLFKDTVSNAELTEFYQVYCNAVSSGHDVFLLGNHAIHNGIVSLNFGTLSGTENGAVFNAHEWSIQKNILFLLGGMHACRTFAVRDEFFPRDPKGLILRDRLPVKSACCKDDGITLRTLVKEVTLLIRHGYKFIEDDVNGIVLHPFKTDTITNATPKSCMASIKDLTYEEFCSLYQAAWASDEEIGLSEVARRLTFYDSDDGGAKSGAGARA